jgi:hypothetical protein
MKQTGGTSPGVAGGALRFLKRSPGSLKGLRRSITALVLVMLCSFSHDLLSADSDVPREYQIKAAFLCNFAKFIEWPASALSNGNSPIVIGVFGKNPFADELEKLARDKTINGHPLIVKRLQNPEELRACHLVFAGVGDAKRLPELFTALRDSSVLTVGESQQFGELGGMINFVLEGDKVRFEIDVDSASRAGLKINAQLQKLARAVHGVPEMGRK